MWAAVTLTIISLTALRLLYEAWRDRRLPPGPKRLPFIGNLHQAPHDVPWRTYHEWFQQYGPLISAQFGGTTVIMIGDKDVAHELLDKRGSAYAERPRMVMAGENLTKGMHQLLRPYDERYLLHRRMEAPALGPRAAATYEPLQDMESKMLLHEFLWRNDFTKRFERYSASLVYSLAYGFRIETGDEQPLKDAHRVQENFGYAGRVGTWVVDALPILNLLPQGPLAPWKCVADDFFRIESALHTRNIATGLSSKAWNWTKELHASSEAAQMDDLEFAYDVGILADAGLDTTTAAMEVFVLACLAYPRFLQHAQRELDEMVGGERLPCLADREKLPYIRACVEETLRWRHIAPGGIPHATRCEDEYMGYRIPKGATVLPAYWTMHLDEKAWDAPLSFAPERWLGQPDGRHFGFGRRVCTGRHIARNSMFLLIARLLWGFDIGHAVDPATGKKVDVDDLALTSGFVSKPEPFPAVFQPRSKHHKEVIEREWQIQAKDLDKLLNGIRDQQIQTGLHIRVKD